MERKREGRGRGRGRGRERDDLCSFKGFQEAGETHLTFFLHRPSLQSHFTFSSSFLLRSFAHHRILTSPYTTINENKKNKKRIKPTTGKARMMNYSFHPSLSLSLSPTNNNKEKERERHCSDHLLHLNSALFFTF